MTATDEPGPPEPRPFRVFWDGRRATPEGWLPAHHDGLADLAREGVPHLTGTVDQVYVGPAIGRVPPWDVVDVFEEFRRILRIGGRIRVAAYDLDTTLEAYARGDLDHFWDRSWRDPAGALASQILEHGAARTLLTAPLLVEMLARAGFADAVEQPFRGTGTDPELARPDRLGSHCCFVEATVTSPWPTVDPTGGPSAIHLGLADPSARAVRVTWCGPPGSDGLVRYREVDRGSWLETAAASHATADGPRGSYVFTSECGPLSAGCRYEYEVVQLVEGRRQVVGDTTFVAPPAGGDASARLAFVADTGISGRADGLSDATGRVIEELAAAAPDVVLAGGDYAYRSGDRRWRSGQQAVHAWLEEMAPLARHHPLMVQYGNHEVELAERYRDWAVHFPPPVGAAADVRSYSFDVGPCHVSAVYVPTGDVDPAEVNWLWEDLADARERECPWLIVYQHQPLFAHGTSHPAEPQVARALARILRAHAVDLHLSAHDQSFERTYPVSWTDAGPRPASREPQRYRRGAGTVLAKVSPGGKRSDRVRGFSILPAERAEIVAAAGDTAHHYAVIDADRSRLRMVTYGLKDGVAPAEPIDEVVIQA